MKKNLIISAVVLCLLSLTVSSGAFSNKPSPDKAIMMLKDGNKRFVQGQSSHPNLNFTRIRQAGTENQREYAYTTVLACSDSRVPLELVFDAGIMDIFVVRVAGNVCGINEAGSIEYGLAHVKTPVLIVLGHTQCGAVTAVAQNIQGEGHKFEENINYLVSPIKPAVKRAIDTHPELHGNDIIPFGIEENVLESIENLFMMSPTARDLVNKGIVKIVGAVYDVSTGRVRWMPTSAVDRILAKVEASPKRVISSSSATETHTGKKPSDTLAKNNKVQTEPAAKPINIEKITLIEKPKLLELLKARDKKITEADTIIPEKKTGISFTTKLVITFIVLFISVFTVFKTKIIGKIGIRNELLLAFFITIVTSLLVGLGAFHKLYTAEKESDIAMTSFNMDIMTNKMRRLQEAFLLEDIVNKNKGDQILNEHKKLTTAYHDSLKKLLQINTDDVELQNINNIQTKMEHYGDHFLNLANNYRNLKAQNYELEKLGDTIEQKLKNLEVKNEEHLADIKSDKKADTTIQTRLVEELVKAEMLSFSVLREKTELLQDKHFDRIEALEKELGELSANLNTAEKLIKLRYTSDQGKKAELEEIEELRKLLSNYVGDISIIIVGEISVETNLADCNNDLKIIDTNFSMLGNRAQKLVAKAKSEYNKVFILLMCLYISGGAYLAFSQTKEITAPLGKANDMVDRMCYGDFTRRLNLDRTDEIGRLAKSLDCMADKFKNLSLKK